MLLPGRNLVLLLFVVGFVAQTQAEFFSRKWLPFADTAEGSVKTLRPRFARAMLRARRALGDAASEDLERNRRALDGFETTATADGEGSGQIHATSFAHTPSDNAGVQSSFTGDINSGSASGNLDTTAHGGSSKAQINADGSTGKSGSNNDGILGGILGSTGSGSNEGLLGGILNTGSNEDHASISDDGDASVSTSGTGSGDSLDCGGDCGVDFDIKEKHPGGSTTANGNVGINTRKGIIGQLRNGIQRGINHIRGILTGKRNNGRGHRDNYSSSSSSSVEYDDYDSDYSNKPMKSSANLGLNVNGHPAGIMVNAESSGELSAMTRGIRNLITRLVNAVLALPYTLLYLILYLVRLTVRVLLLPLRLLGSLIHGTVHVRHV